MENRPELLAQIRDVASRYGAKKALAKALSYSRGTIYEKLRRDDGFTDDELRRAAAALGVAADPPAGSGMAEAPAPYRAVGGLDEALMEETIGIVLEILAEDGVVADPDETTRKIMELYREDRAARDAGDRLTPVRILRLVRGGSNQS